MHGNVRGYGYASLLARALVRQITARGETPFLHLYSVNTIAAAPLAGGGRSRPAPGPATGNVGVYLKTLDVRRT